jgi:hypothetical protein
MTDADRLKEFARSYQRLRQLQKAFFRAKTDDNLRAAKKAEKELDGEANQILNFTTPSLFAPRNFLLSFNFVFTVPVPMPLKPWGEGGEVAREL